MTTRLCACGCGEPLPPPRSNVGQPRKWVNGSHAARARWRDPEFRERQRARKRGEQGRILGRVCVWCGVTDGERNWSSRVGDCGRCARQRERNPCPHCGGPYYAQPRREQRKRCGECGRAARKPGKLIAPAGCINPNCEGDDE